MCVLAMLDSEHVYCAGRTTLTAVSVEVWYLFPGIYCVLSQIVGSPICGACYIVAAYVAAESAVSIAQVGGAVRPFCHSAACAMWGLGTI